ncbi:hypothetical protein JW964_25510 [candidate division KSB1 bacterium]|nr:hypothetical protein [candidate division KSB1 bacterium]
MPTQLAYYGFKTKPIFIISKIPHSPTPSAAATQTQHSLFSRSAGLRRNAAAPLGGVS